MCGVEDDDTGQDKAQNTSLEAMNPCPALRGMDGKCSLERQNATSKKSPETAAQSN
jgi:hypothetical protein